MTPCFFGPLTFSLHLTEDGSQPSLFAEFFSLMLYNTYTNEMRDDTFSSRIHPYDPTPRPLCLITLRSYSSSFLSSHLYPP